MDGKEVATIHNPTYVEVEYADGEESITVDNEIRSVTVVDIEGIEYR